MKPASSHKSSVCGDNKELDSKRHSSKKPNKDKRPDTSHRTNSSLDKTFKAIIIVTLVSIIAYYINIWYINPKTYNVIVEDTLKSMLRIESRVSINPNLNVAVGFGSCLDLYVSSRDLILDVSEAPQLLVHHESIQNQEHLSELFGYFFSEGAAAERYIDNRSFFGELVTRARSAQKVRKAIGGNAAVMANRFVMEGVERVILGTQMSRETQNDFSDKLMVSGPLVDQDDVHICIEYPAGEKWGKYVAPRANRLIIHSDHFNSVMESVDKFIDRIESAKKLDLLVIGGLQMMDNIPKPMDVRRKKLERLNQVLTKLSLDPKSTKVHLELASFTEEALLQSILQLVIPHVHSLGMNEQELPNLLNFLSNSGVNLLSESYPRVATSLDQMRSVFQLLQAPTNGSLSRIHVHTLAFQAILTKAESPWKNTLTSSVKAALTAHRYTCGSHDIDVVKAKLIMDESYTTSQKESRRQISFDPNHPVVCWQENITYKDSLQNTIVDQIEICIAPVLVCTKVKQTAGAGDNVSAAGLIYQL